MPIKLRSDPMWPFALSVRLWLGAVGQEGEIERANAGENPDAAGSRARRS